MGRHLVSMVTHMLCLVAQQMIIAFGCCKQPAYAWLRTHTTGACWPLQRAAQFDQSRSRTLENTTESCSKSWLVDDYSQYIGNRWKSVIIQQRESRSWPSSHVQIPLKKDWELTIQDSTLAMGLIPCCSLTMTFPRHLEILLFAQHEEYMVSLIPSRWNDSHMGWTLVSLPLLATWSWWWSYAMFQLPPWRLLLKRCETVHPDQPQGSTTGHQFISSSSGNDCFASTRAETSTFADAGRVGRRVWSSPTNVFDQLPVVLHKAVAEVSE